MSSPLASPASRRGFLLVVLAALCWGTSGVSGRIVADRTDLGPLDIAWHRMAIGAVVLLIGTALTRRRSGPIPALTRGTAVRLVLVGAGLAAYQLAYFAAVATAGVSIATLVALGLAPLLIAVGATVLGHGRPDRATVIALVVALIGLVLLVGISAEADTGTTVLLGALLAVGSALGYAVVTLAGAGVPAGIPVTLVGFAGGALLLTPVALIVGLRFTTDPVALAVLLYLGLVPSEYSSADRRHLGHITKAGNARARWLLVEAGWRILRSKQPETAALRAWGAAIAARRGNRIAAVAVARRLAGVLYAMWRDGVPYDAAKLARGQRGVPRSPTA